MDDAPVLNRVLARRLRAVYRSAGWPCQDMVEIDLLALGLLERVLAPSGHESVRLTDAGIAYVARAAQNNRRAFSAHEALIDTVVQALLREGRVVWTNLSLRAWVPPEAHVAGRWKITKPDVFSIRNSTVPTYLEPVVHEIKVSRADLLGDLKQIDKRNAYLSLGGQCWYVLGCNAKGKPIGTPDEIPAPCGVMFCVDGKLDIIRNAQRRAAVQLPFDVWMALAKAAPFKGFSPPQEALVDQTLLPAQTL